LHETLHSFPIWHSGVHCLIDLLAVRDAEELLVLHPGQGRGYRVRAGGIGDNFQLHTLLAGRQTLGEFQLLGCSVEVRALCHRCRKRTSSRSPSSV